MTETNKQVHRDVAKVLAPHALYISDIVVSDISKNIVISFQIETNESPLNFYSKVRIIIESIQKLGTLGYGLYLDAHNSFNYTLATMSFTENQLHQIDFESSLDLEAYSNHYSVPDRYRLK